MISGKGKSRAKPITGAVLVVALAWAGPGFAHTSERGQIMLLPTELYVLGGSLVVAASILLAAALPFLNGVTAQASPVDVVRLTPLRRGALSLFGLAMLVLLIAAGLWGPPDPISNPLPGVVWSLWWVGFTAVTLVFGNLWPALNPWTGLFGLLQPRNAPPLRYPIWMGRWPAVIMLFGFAWFELVYPTPHDPVRLATVVFAYASLTFLALYLFGRVWLLAGECFSVYFRMLSLMSPLQWEAGDGSLRLRFVLPGAALLREDSKAPGSAAFVLLALASVSFDGFMRTFSWVASVGNNPLEFPGRSAVLWPNTFGLLAMCVVLAAVYWLAVRAGRTVAGTPGVPGLVLSIVPIAIAYHLAHYLPGFPVAVLQTARALGDPFGMGLDLFGWTAIHPPASIMMDHEIATLVYRSQTAIIVIGHVVAVIVAHAKAIPVAGSPRLAQLSLLPLNTVMVLYTMFGLWLLSTPVIG